MPLDPATFDEIVDRRGTHCAKWDAMERLFGVSPRDGLSMWVADMDFRPPRAVTDALERLIAHGIFGYYGDDTAYKAAVTGWMETRHNWVVDPDHVLSTNGLVNAVGLCVDAYTAPGEAVVLFTPVYHAFAKVIRAGGRSVTECPLVEVEGRYEMDFDAYDALLTGKERMAILCSPHNPGGTVWTRAELEEVAAFARRHDLVLVSDEIHHDLLYPGQTHTPMAAIEGVADRLVMLTAATKTFNIAAAHVGNVIIADAGLRARFSERLLATGTSPGGIGIHMVTAAYSPEGAEWLTALMSYLEGNRRVFDAGVAGIPGLRSMPLEATYLGWVDFSGTGMTPEEIAERVEQGARIAANRGPTFGKGGEHWMRFNLGMPRARIEEAVARLADAFRDLQ